MTEPIREGTFLWEPSEDLKARTNINRYLNWLKKERGLLFRDYQSLWEWSVTDLEDFWASIWNFFDVKFLG